MFLIIGYRLFILWGLDRFKSWFPSMTNVGAIAARFDKKSEVSSIISGDMSNLACKISPATTITP